jgi:hypothetical protein
MAALHWAIFEEKRRTVRMLISKVFLVREQDGCKRIIPQFAFDIPQEFASLVYSYQSLDYRPDWVETKFDAKLKLTLDDPKGN